MATGLLVVNGVGVAIALGKYDQLAAWACKEAFGSRATTVSTGQS